MQVAHLPQKSGGTMGVAPVPNSAAQIIRALVHGFLAPLTPLPAKARVIPRVRYDSGGKK